MILIHNR